MRPRRLRVNYQILGNSWPHLHAHVHARYDWEPPPPYRDVPVWLHPDRDDPRHRLDQRHDALRADLAAELARLLAQVTEETSDDLLTGFSYAGSIPDVEENGPTT